MSEPSPSDLALRKPVDVVLDLISLAFVQKKVDEGFLRNVAEVYIQHNPSVPDGRDAAIEFFHGMWRELPDFHYDIRHVLTGDSGLVAVHAKATGKPDEGDRGAVIVDIFRVEEGLIREHWDSVQMIPETAANDHPMF